MQEKIYNKGWNLVSFIENLNLDDLITYFQGKYIENTLYSYDNTLGYSSVENVEINKGYWIKLSETIVVIISLNTGLRIKNELKVDWQTAHNLYIDQEKGILYALGTNETELTSANNDDNHNHDNKHHKTKKILNRDPGAHGSSWTYALKPLYDEFGILVPSTEFATPLNPKDDGSNGGTGLDNASREYYHDLVTYTYDLENDDNTSEKVTIAYGSGEQNGITVRDVTHANSEWTEVVPLLTSYQNADFFTPTTNGYLHQIWTSSDGRYIFANDEFMQRNCVIVYDMKPTLDSYKKSIQTANPTLCLWNQNGSNLEPSVDGTGQNWTNETATYNHNLYVHYLPQYNCDVIFHSCYSTGVRIYKVIRDDPNNTIDLIEIGNFLGGSNSSAVAYERNWSNFFWNDDQNLCILSDITYGVFLIKMNLVMDTNGNLDSVNIEELDRKPNPTVSNGNDCWGYTSKDNIKYALVGMRTSLEIYRIEDNQLNRITGITHSGSIWADVKVYLDYDVNNVRTGDDYCYCVNESNNGLQVISLKDIDNDEVSDDAQEEYQP